MHTPSAALAWQLWHRHRNRLVTIVGLLLGFALVYPKLCALAGFNLNSPDAADELGGKLVSSGGITLSVERVLRFFYYMFLAGGPASAMVVSLLYVVWMFVFAELDPSTKDIMKFPGRLFTLPVSTSFLFWWLFLAGLTSVAALYASWVYFVQLPHLDIFGVYQNCFGCMTLLALGQGIVWALAAWPLTRMFLLMVVLFGYLFAPAWSLVVPSSLVLPPLFVLGAILARAGLQKMRHGQWQGWNWNWPFATMASRAELRGPKRFASTAQAQLWFEWRRSARRLCFCAAVFAVLPLATLLLARVGFGRPLQDDTMHAFAVSLVAMPLFLHFCFAISPAKTDLPFLMIRPVTNGQMMMARLKAAGISTVFSWVAALAALCAMPWLGNFHPAEQAMFPPPPFRLITLVFGNNTLGIHGAMFPPPPFRLITLIGSMLLAWRLIAVNLCCTWSGKRWLNGVPTLLFLVAYLSVFLLSILSRNSVFWDPFRRVLPTLLACLIAVKFLLAFLAFRLSLRRRLLAPSALVGYLIVWLLLAASLLIPAAILFHGNPWFVTSAMGIVLLTPLARIGFCPITLSWNRHA
jgi:hypothetical protein